MYTRYAAFPDVDTTRQGPRGNVRYHYMRLQYIRMEDRIPQDPELCSRSPERKRKADEMERSSGRNSVQPHKDRRQDTHNLETFSLLAEMEGSTDSFCISPVGEDEKVEAGMQPYVDSPATPEKPLDCFASPTENLHTRLGLTGPATLELEQSGLPEIAWQWVPYVYSWPKPTLTRRQRHQDLEESLQKLLQPDGWDVAPHWDKAWEPLNFLPLLQYLMQPLRSLSG